MPREERRQQGADQNTERDRAGDVRREEVESRSSKQTDGGNGGNGTHGCGPVQASRQRSATESRNHERPLTKRVFVISCFRAGSCAVAEIARRSDLLGLNSGVVILQRANAEALPP